MVIYYYLNNVILDNGNEHNHVKSDIKMLNIKLV